MRTKGKQASSSDAPTAPQVIPGPMAFSSAAALAMGRAMQSTAGADQELADQGKTLEARAQEAMVQGKAILPHLN